MTQRKPLPSMKWTRSTNGTHGSIHVVLDFSNERPKPTAVSAYQTRTSDKLR